MATLDWHTTGQEGVTLVHLLVTSEATERVRVDNCLDGPVWPPRSQGVPEAGWDSEGYEGVVDADGRLLLGYATPSDPADPPARLASAERVEETVDAVTAREVVRTLGDPRPTRDAIPGEAGGNAHVSAEPGDGSDETGQSTARAGPRSGLPPDAEAWFAEVTERIEDAERLARAGSVPEATAAVDAVGGSAAVTELGERLERDHERLDGVAERSRALADRIESVDVSVETLRRLA